MLQFAIYVSHIDWKVYTVLHLRHNEPQTHFRLKIIVLRDYLNVTSSLFSL